MSMPYLVTPYNSLTERAIKDNSMIFWIMNNSMKATPSKENLQANAGPFQLIRVLAVATRLELAAALA